MNRSARSGARQSITIRGRTFNTLNQTVKSMMTFAFGLHPDQIVGGPEWIGNDRFDMKDFCGTMQAVVLDRPVVDQTGIEGRYDFTLPWTPDETQFGGRGGQLPPTADPANAPPGLFTAIQEQFGLKLDASRLAVEVYVIDRLNKPEAN